MNNRAKILSNFKFQTDKQLLTNQRHIVVDDKEQKTAAVRDVVREAHTERFKITHVLVRLNEVDKTNKIINNIKNSELFVLKSLFTSLYKTNLELCSHRL